jgi:hypothetical protein
MTRLNQEGFAPVAARAIVVGVASNTLVKGVLAAVIGRGLFRLRVVVALAAMFAALVECPAEVIFLGANYDETLTYPPLFEEHILPWLAELADLSHRHGKLLLTHTDGENQRLLPLFRRAGFDIADSLCPAPMTKVTLQEAIEALPGVTIWGGIPSVALLEEAMSEADFDRLVGETVQLAEGRSHLILGIADTTPAGASLARIEKITRRVNG